MTKNQPAASRRASALAECHPRPHRCGRRRKIRAAGRGRNTKINVYLDHAAVTRFVLITEQKVKGDLRRYYCTSRGDDRLMLLVTRGNTTLDQLVGHVVDATIGWDRGADGYVYHVSRLHSKLSIHRVVNAQRTTTLSALLASAPHA